MLRVIEAESVAAPDGSRAKVVVESDLGGPPFQGAFDELKEGMAARVAAMGWAVSKGVAPAHMNGNVIGPYPVNAEGLPLERVRGPAGEPLPMAHARMQPWRYRVDVPLARPL